MKREKNGVGKPGCSSPGLGGKDMAAGDITFIECPRGDSFPVRKTADRSSGSQQVVCPKCGHSFDVIFPESVERLSREAVMAGAESTNHHAGR
jgi:hypothetical protein